MSKPSTYDGLKSGNKPCLLSLPEELIEHICQSLTNTQLQTTPDVRAALSNFCLVSKTCDRIGRPFLYRYIQLNRYEIVRFTKSVLDNNKLGGWVKSAVLNVTFGDQSFSVADTSFFLSHIKAEGTHDVEELERLTRAERYQVNDLFWTVVVETLLLKLHTVEAVTLHWDGGQDFELMGGSRIKRTPEDLLPSLTHFAYNEVDKLGNIGTLNKILETRSLRSLIAAGCEYFEVGNLPAVRNYSSLQDIRLVNCRWLDKVQLQQLVAACPNLSTFKWVLMDMEDDDDDEEDEDYPITATDIVEVLKPLRKTLKALAMTTDSMGDDDGFPSLRSFTALEDFQVDVFDLIDYEEDDETDDEDEEDDDEEDDFEDALSDEAEDGETITISHSSTDGDNTVTTNIHISTDTNATNIDNVSSSENACKPILHLLPQSLKHLWIDNMDCIDGDLDDQLLKLATTAQEDFPKLCQLTIESDGNNAKLHDTFVGAGIQFTQRKVGHNWSYHDGLGAFLENESDNESESESEAESSLDGEEDEDEEEEQDDDEEEDEDDLVIEMY